VRVAKDIVIHNDAARCVELLVAGRACWELVFSVAASLDGLCNAEYVVVAEGRIVAAVAVVDIGGEDYGGTDQCEGPRAVGRSCMLGSEKAGKWLSWWMRYDG